MIKYAALIVAATTVAALYVRHAGAAAKEGVRAGVHLPVAEFDGLYGQNCAGCHGVDGTGGAARGLADPVFLRIADEATLRRITAGGVSGTAMPGFALTAGGALTDAQVDAIVRGVRTRWTRDGDEDALAPPPYSTPAAGDPDRGGTAFAAFCARCHGADGRGGIGGSSVVDPSYLSLVSDQSLRTTVIAGRPDLGAPDWRNDTPGRPMSSDEVSDVVAWLASKRPQN